MDTRTAASEPMVKLTLVRCGKVQCRSSVLLPRQELSNGSVWAYGVFSGLVHRVGGSSERLVRFAHCAYNVKSVLTRSWTGGTEAF
jgi:hypothetical protein